jgi:outer membrane protein assembly factor BamB
LTHIEPRNRRQITARPSPRGVLQFSESTSDSPPSEGGAGGVAAHQRRSIAQRSALDPNRPPLLRLIAATLALALFATTAAADWPQFRGPDGQGHAPSSANLPSEWTETQNVAWKADVPGLGWSSPVIVEGRIYLTTAVPKGRGKDGDQSLRALCLDATSGKLLWNVEVFQQSGDKAEPIHTKNSHASPTPLVDGPHVFVHFGTHGTACLTRDGKVVWRNRELKYVPQHGNGGSPCLVDDLLVLCCDGTDVQFVVALDRAIGKIRWKKDRPPLDRAQTFSFSTPLAIEVDGRTQLVCPATNFVIAYDPATGDEIWTVRYNGYSVIPRPVFGHGLVFVCTGYNTPSLLAIRPDGRGDVTDTHVAWKRSRSIPHTPSPLLVGEELYVVSDRGIATCLDAKTGNVHWEKRLGGNYSASPVLADGKLYLLSEDGEAIVLTPGRQYAEIARNRLKARTLASYGVADGSLFLRTDERLYRLTSERESEAEANWLPSHAPFGSEQSTEGTP